MHYCYMDSQDRLIAVVERVGNGRPSSPVRWLLRWAPRLQLEDSAYGDRFEAVATIRRLFPKASVRVFNVRGERVR